MKPDMLNVLTDDKEYRVVQDGEGRLYALRYDEPWRDLVGDNLILRLAQDLDNARTRLAKIAEALQLDL